jgi:MFS family permease
VLSGPVAGRLIRGLGSRPTLIAGMTLAALLFAALSPPAAVARPALLLPGLGLLGLALGCVQVSGTHLLVDSAPAAASGSVNGLQGVAVQTGGALGVAVLGALMSAVGVSAFRGTLSAHGIAAGGPAAAARISSDVPQAVAPPLPHLTAAAGETVRRATESAFTTGLHAVFLTCAAVLATGLAAGLAGGTASRARKDSGRTRCSPVSSDEQNGRLPRTAPGSFKPC